MGLDIISNKHASCEAVQEVEKDNACSLPLACSWWKIWYQAKSLLFTACWVPEMDTFFDLFLLPSKYSHFLHSDLLVVSWKFMVKICSSVYFFLIIGHVIGLTEQNLLIMSIVYHGVNRNKGYFNITWEGLSCYRQLTVFTEEKINAIVTQKTLFTFMLLADFRFTVLLGPPHGQELTVLLEGYLCHGSCWFVFLTCNGHNNTACCTGWMPKKSWHADDQGQPSLWWPNGPFFHNTNSHMIRSKGKGRTAVTCTVILAACDSRTAATMCCLQSFAILAVDLNQLAENVSSYKKIAKKVIVLPLLGPTRIL